MLVLHISIFGPARVQEIFGLAGFVKKNVSKARFSTFQFLQPTQGFIFTFINFIKSYKKYKKRLILIL